MIQQLDILQRTLCLRKLGHDTIGHKCMKVLEHMYNHVINVNEEEEISEKNLFIQYQYTNHFTK